MARREERANREFVSDEQRRQPGCPAWELCHESRGRDTSVAARLRSLSGRDIIRILNGFGFNAVATRGSHAKLRRITESGQRQILTIPLHKDLAPGTLHAIYRQALKFVAAEQLRRHFFHE